MELTQPIRYASNARRLDVWGNFWFQHSIEFLVLIREAVFALQMAIFALIFAGDAICGAMKALSNLLKGESSVVRVFLPNVCLMRAHTSHETKTPIWRDQNTG